MKGARIVVELPLDLLHRVDGLVARRVYRSRSCAIQMALGEKIRRITSTRLGRECAKLDPGEEKSFAEGWTGGIWRAGR